jgi:hypothetical protein
LQTTAERMKCNDSAKRETQELAISPMWRQLACYCRSQPLMAKPLRRDTSREAETTCPFWNIGQLLTQFIYIFLKWKVANREKKKMYIRGFRNRPDGAFRYKVEISIMSTPRFHWSHATSSN